MIPLFYFGRVGSGRCGSNNNDKPSVKSTTKQGKKALFLMELTMDSGFVWE